MLKYFNSNNPSVILLLFIYGLILRIGYYISPATHICFPLECLPMASLKSFWFLLIEFKYINYVLAYFVVFIQSIYFNQIINKWRILNRLNYYTALFYITLTAFFPELVVLSFPLIMLFIIFLFLQINFTIYRKERWVSSVFDTGLLMGLLILFEPQFVIYFFFGIFLLLSFRSFNLKEWLAYFIGYFIPLFLCFTWLFIHNNADSIFIFFSNQIKISFSALGLSKVDLIKLSALGFALLVVFLSLTNITIGNVVLVRKILSSFVYLAIVGAIIYFISNNKNISYFYLLVPSLSLYFAYYICASKNKWITNGLFYFLILTIIIFQIFN